MNGRIGFIIRLTENNVTHIYDIEYSIWLHVHRLLAFNIPDIRIYKYKFIITMYRKYVWTQNWTQRHLHFKDTSTVEIV